MKKITLLTTLIFAVIISFAQVPNAFKYQTVIRDASGNILQNQNVSLRFKIHNNTASGTVLYSETQTLTTNQFGLVSLSIGNGTVVSGDFSTIPWGTNSKFLEVELDPNGGSSYTSMGTSQLLSVPYAQYSDGSNYAHFADTCLVALFDFDTDNTNEIQDISLNGNQLSITNGSTVTLSSQDDDWNYISGSGLTGVINHSGNVAIGTTVPTEKLDVQGKIAIDNEQTVYNANAIDNLNNSLIYGNGGTNLSHSSGTEAWENTFVGIDAGNDATTGNYNTYVGAKSGKSNTSGIDNTFVGAGAGETNLSGESNTMIGKKAGYLSKGSDNTFIGKESGFLNSNGSANVFVGHKAGYQETGSNKLYIDNSNTTTPLIYGDFSTDEVVVNGSLEVTNKLYDILGSEGSAGQVLYTTGSGIRWNTLPVDNDDDSTNELQTISKTDSLVTLSHSGGSFVDEVNDIDADTTNEIQTLSILGMDISISKGNTITVPSSADNLGNHIATQNIKLSNQWLSNDGDNEGVYVLADGKVGVGTNTPTEQLDVNGKIAINGKQVIYFADAVNSNFQGSLIIGDGGKNLSHTTNYEAWNNTFIGCVAGLQTTTGKDNTAIGNLALRDNTTGDANVACGDAALLCNTTGKHNVAIGGSALWQNLTGKKNVALGTAALRDLKEGDNNTAIGNYSGFENINGDRNVFIGNRAGYYETGSDKLYIGNSDTSSPLIYGDFSKDSLAINGSLSIKNELIDASISNNKCACKITV